MALTARTAEFHKLRTELDQIASSPQGLTPQGVTDFLRKKGVDPKEFKFAWNQFKESGYQADRPGMFIGRVTGRAIGETAEFLGDTSKMIMPEITEDVINWLGENVSADVRRASAELFDPYHGDGWVEPIVGELASILVPYGGIMKGARWAKTGLKMVDKPKKIPGGTVTIPVTGAKVKRTTPIKGWAKRERKRLRKEKFKRRGKGLVKEGLGIGGAMTVVYSPEEDQLTNIIEQFPESSKIFEGLAINPNDPELLQQWETFRNNIILETPFLLAGLGVIAGGPALAQAARKMKLSKTIVQETGLSNLGKWAKRKMSQQLTSRYGVDDTMLAMGLRRMFGGNKAVSEADGLAQDLMRVVKVDSKKAGMKPSEIEETVNEALGGNQGAIATLQTMSDSSGNRYFRDTSNLVGRLRIMIDDLSEAITDEHSGIVTGQLRATMKANKGIYLNRAYRLFDDPSFKGWDGIPDNIKENALAYVRRQGANDDQAEYILKKILSKREGKDFTDTKVIRFLSDMSQKSNKPFYKRSQIPWEIKDLIGEIKDPYKNFARTYEKLSIAKAEADFLHSVRKHLIDQDLARGSIRAPAVSMGPSRLPQPLPPAGTTQEQALEGLADVGNERLKRILGEEALDRENYQGINPLEDLFGHEAPESYVKFIREGTELFSPAGGLAKAFLISKIGTQTAKTVLSPATHSRNVMGNVILMGANGYIPFTIGRERGAWETVTNRLRGYSDENFGKYIGRLQELGIIDSSVKAQTVKKIASEAFSFEPQGWMSRLAKSKVGVGTRKIFETYQAEDDMFKIIHFQKTMDDMKKWNLGLSNDALEEMAAARTRDLMPNYALVPKTVKYLRRSPLSDFAAWPAEVTRVSKNILKYAYNDASGRTLKQLQKQGFDISPEAAEAIRGQGYRRSAGLITASMAGDALQNYTMNMFGLGQEDVYNINRLSPSWSQDTAKVFLSPINEDKNKHIGVNFINLGPIDPFSYLKAPARMLASHLRSGRNLDRPDYAKLNIAAYDNLMGPFLGASMATELAMKLASGTLTKEGLEVMTEDYGGFAVKAGTDILKAFEPGVSTLIRKQLQYHNPITGGRKAAGERRGEGAQSQYGYTMPSAEFEDSGAFLRWAGIRKQRLDISAGMRRNLLPLIKNIDNASAEFTSAAGDPRGRSEKDLLNVYKDSLMKELLSYKELKSLTETYDSLLKDANLTDKSITVNDRVEALQRGVTKNYGLKLNPNLGKYMTHARQNRFVPFIPTDEAILFAQQTSGNIIPWDKIWKLYNASNNKTITD